MSLRNLLVFSLLVLPFGLCNSQTTPAKPIEPTAIGVIYHLDPVNQELKKLPDEQWKQVLGRNMLDIVIQVPGVGSSFHVKAGERSEFVFKTGSPEKVSLYSLVQKKNKREFQIQKQPSRFNPATEPIKGLSIEVSKFGESSYMLVPASPLAPGEYAIVIADELYTFGVDQ
jgi:hypothetical protein